eukprot:scaffold377_cov193-Alexandrium_tamarense.AAC.7
MHIYYHSFNIASFRVPVIASINKIGGSSHDGQLRRRRLLDLEGETPSNTMLNDRTHSPLMPNFFD